MLKTDAGGENRSAEDAVAQDEGGRASVGLPASRRRVTAFLLLTPVLLSGACRRAETAEAAKARLLETVYEQQIAGLEKLITEAERGGGIRKDRLAVGIDETVVRELVNATLPVDVRIGDELTVQLQKADAYFRFTQAAVLLEGRASSVRFPGVFVALQLMGRLDDVKLTEGRFAAKVRLVHAQIQGVTLGTIAKDLVDVVLKKHLGEIEAAIPAFEVPVRLEQAIKIDGLGKGPVSVQPGMLPLEISVARVLPGNRRLWVMIDLKVGQWRPQAASVPARAAALPAQAKRPASGAKP